MAPVFQPLSSPRTKLFMITKSSKKFSLKRFKK